MPLKLHAIRNTMQNTFTGATNPRCLPIPNVSNGSLGSADQKHNDDDAFVLVVHFVGQRCEAISKQNPDLCKARPRLHQDLWVQALLLDDLGPTVCCVTLRAVISSIVVNIVVFMAGHAVARCILERRLVAIDAIVFAMFSGQRETCRCVIELLCLEFADALGQ